MKDEVIKPSCFDCAKCIANCKAKCCGAAPLPTKTIQKHGFARTPKICEKITDDTIIAVDADGYCCYLDHDLKCSIYNDRPGICKQYGDESHIALTCMYQSKGGMLRSRQGRRRLMSLLEKYVAKFSQSK